MEAPCFCLPYTRSSRDSDRSRPGSTLERSIRGFNQSRVAAHNADHTFRNRLGVDGYVKILAASVRVTQALNLAVSDLSMLPKNRRKG